MSLHKLLEEQREYLETLERESQEAALLLASDAQNELSEGLKFYLEQHKEESFTVQVHRNLLAQATAVSESLQASLAAELKGRSIIFGKAGLNHVVQQVEKMEGSIGGAFRLDLALGIQGKTGLRSKAALKRYGAKQVDKFEQQIQRSVLVKMPRHEAVNRILEAADKSHSVSRHHASLILRNEMGNAYDRDGFRAQMRLSDSLTKRGSESLMARMDEARDRRSHPFSIIAHGTIAEVGKPWKVSVAAVTALMKKRGGGGTGILWEKDETLNFWVGDSYIAHHNDRGRRTCWRKSWGDPRRV